MLIEESMIVGEEEVQSVMCTFLQIDVMDLSADKKRAEEKGESEVVHPIAMTRNTSNQNAAVVSGRLLVEVLGVSFSLSLFKHF